MTESLINCEKKEKFPQIYVYSMKNNYQGCLKIGYTTKKNVIDRIKEQFPIQFPDGKEPFKLEYSTDAFDKNGNQFSDHEVHEYLKNSGFNQRAQEWFECSIEDVKSAIIAVKKGIKNVERRFNDFKMRPEQEAAVIKTSNYFKSYEDTTEKPRFLWNAKMRFGKTFTAYQLAKKMDWKRVLILTFKPAVQSSWKEDLLTHLDFENWQFVSKNDIDYEECDKEKPIVCFGSLQDYLGRTETGEIKPKNKWVHKILWDCIIFDEYHFGAWRRNTRELVDDLDGEEVLEEYVSEDEIPIKTKHYLYLSGTPFKFLNNGTFSENQIFNWTYSDEQEAKENWVGEDNPYKFLPKIKMLTYKLPDEISDVAKKGNYNEFDLNEFFKAEFDNSVDKCSKFKHQKEVQKWLNFIIGGDISSFFTSNDVIFPFDDYKLQEFLQHTVWFLPDIASCYAMYDLLKSGANTFFKKYEILLVAGDNCGNGAEARIPVDNAMRPNPLNKQTITLTCGKLTTGVTIKPWTGIFMLRNCKSPETYFQAAFRVQSPWTIKDENLKEINLKEECYVFDFDPNRTLIQIKNYCDTINTTHQNIESVVSDFIKYLPVLAYNGLNMEQIDAKGLIDIAMGKTTATLLSKGWDNSLLINLNPSVINDLIDDENTLNIINTIVFKESSNSNNNLEIIVKKHKELEHFRKKIKRPLTKKEKEKCNSICRSIEKERKEFEKKLRTLLARLPLFLYLSDAHETNFQEILHPSEEELFQKVMGMKSDEFRILEAKGLFNSVLLNNAIYDFNRYEEDSLNYIELFK